MCSPPTWSFITDSKLTKTKPESCVRNVHLLEKKNNNKNNRKEKTEKFVFQMKKEKKEVSPWNYLKYRDNFNITPTGVGLLPTHHDKNNERSSGIRPLGL